MLPADVAADLARHGITRSGEACRRVGGGSINRALRVPTAAGPLFLKLNAPGSLELFEAEADGLAALAGVHAAEGPVAAQAVVPAVLAVGCCPSAAYLALEWVELGSGSAEAERALGRALARQHAVTAPDSGWHRDNFIGATPQPNARSARWIEFFAERRLGQQLALAERRGLPPPLAGAVRRVAAALADYFPGGEPAPSLLHGDLWGGNWGAAPGAVPCLFDPAVYFGDAEADLAMTRLFGGFGPAFYEAYEALRPPRPGAAARVDLYNLYHLLNHFNLFGAGYLPSIEAALGRLQA